MYNTQTDSTIWLILSNFSTTKHNVMLYLKDLHNPKYTVLQWHLYREIFILLFYLAYGCMFITRLFNFKLSLVSTLFDYILFLAFFNIATYILHNFKYYDNTLIKYILN